VIVTATACDATSNVDIEARDPQNAKVLHVVIAATPSLWAESDDSATCAVAYSELMWGLEVQHSVGGRGLTYRPV
jgi:hypothetical protein